MKYCDGSLVPYVLYMVTKHGRKNQTGVQRDTDAAMEISQTPLILPWWFEVSAYTHTHTPASSVLFGGWENGFNWDFPIESVTCMNHAITQRSRRAESLQRFRACALQLQGTEPARLRYTWRRTSLRAEEERSDSQFTSSTGLLTTIPPSVHVGVAMIIAVVLKIFTSVITRFFWRACLSGSLSPSTGLVCLIHGIGGLHKEILFMNSENVIV